jgi:phage terminase large subunit
MQPNILDISLPHIYGARDYQQDSWDAFHGEGEHEGKDYRIFVKVWHRRAGKDMTDWNMAIERINEEPMTCKYAFPTGDMARANLWESYTNDGNRFTDFFPEDIRVKRNKGDDGLNDSLKRIESIIGGSVRVISAHNPDRLRGSNDKLFVLSEFQAMDPMVIDIIMPIVEANGGKILINMTANGDSAAKVLLEAWRDDPTVYVSELSALDTPVFKPEQLKRIKQDTIVRFSARGQSEEEAIAFFEQEYMCNWDSPVIGSYFGTAMRRADSEGRITRVPHEEMLPVYTWWDLGVSDSTAIWFVQLFNREVRLIDYYENSGEGFAHYAKVLNGQLEGKEHMRYYNYAKKGHKGPHDLAVRNLGKDARSRLEIAKSLGIDFDIVKRIAAKEDGIEATRALLSRCWFDAEKCSRGISALKGYKKEWNEKMMIYADRPVHDWTSHGVDAFQTGALTNPMPSNVDDGGRVTRTINSKGGRQQTTYATPDGKQVLNLDFKRAYRGKRR